MFFNTMKGRIIAPGILFLTLSLACSSSYANVQADTAEKKSSSTADHSKFEILQDKFATGPDVTKACLSCHPQVHGTNHPAGSRLMR